MKHKMVWLEIMTDSSSAASGCKDTLAEWLRRLTAKAMGSPRMGSNPSGVDLTNSRMVACVSWIPDNVKAALQF